jgi:hypothetical protein
MESLSEIHFCGNQAAERKRSFKCPMIAELIINTIYIILLYSIFFVLPD